MVNSQQTLKVIRQVKKAVQKAGTVAVAKHMNCTRQGLYYHFDENKPASLEHLGDIAEAARIVTAEKEKQALKQIGTLTKKLSA
jgi:hypothetical protein